MEYKVTLTPKARRDLATIWNYIARNDRDAATTFCHNLAEQAFSLRIFPERYFELPERRNVRKISYQSYLIFYEIHGDQHWVEILRFWHSAQDQRRLRLKEEPLAVYSVSPGAAPVTAQLESSR
ncbi:MAG: type II toxin-antitoxin system RelE/ParE family toxin [Methylacidiphilales bacterium]|nr:type II toxin-antitoxin system RelE/ParE family toxin [Candidatus Methylacidiphilales bacterium]